MKSTAILAAALLCAISPLSSAKPIKVCILAGQSNMEGHAEIITFDYIGRDPATAPLLKEMRNRDGTPRICENVWMSYLTGPYDGSANGEGVGKLTAGFGAREGNPTQISKKIGPEFTFGITMEKELKEPILSIKTAWGGRSLNTKLRPPRPCASAILAGSPDHAATMFTSPAAPVINGEDIANHSNVTASIHLKS